MDRRPLSIVSGVLCLGLATYLFFFGKSTLAFAFAKWQFRNSPEMWIVPKPLLPDATPDTAGLKLTYFGYELESPFAETKEEKRFESVVVLSLSDCAGMAILKPQLAGWLVRTIQQEESKEGREVKNVFGEEAMRSDYAFRSKTLNLTPRDIHLLSSPKEVMGNAVLLSMKSVERERFKNGLYSFESSWMRGFQEGDLKLDKGVVIEAFDKQDRLLTLTVGAKPGKSCFSQSDLNRIVFSLRPVAPG